MMGGLDIDENCTKRVMNSETLTEREKTLQNRFSYCAVSSSCYIMALWNCSGLLAGMRREEEI